MLSNLKIRTGLLLMLLALSALALVATLFGLHSVREADDAMQRLNSLIAEQGRHVRAAYDASSRAVLDAFHRAALAAGASDEGAPGLRPHYHPDYYGAYMRDLDGHKICCVCHAPA